jgi:hypothetical protein
LQFFQAFLLRLAGFFFLLSLRDRIAEYIVNLVKIHLFKLLHLGKRLVLCQLYQKLRCLTNIFDPYRVVVDRLS